MSYYRICPDCGDNLDPGERCDCRLEALRREAFDLLTQLTDEEVREVLEGVTAVSGAA